MNRGLFLGLVIALICTGAYALSHFERHEDSFIFVTKESVYDPLGVASDFYNRITRDCSTVSVVPSKSEDLNAIKNVLSHLKEPVATPAIPLSIMREGDWFIVESDFEQLEPAIFLLNKHGSNFDVLTTAIWSGTPAPWKPGPEIRKYMKAKAPEAPTSLIRCFEPTLEHFKS